MRSPFLLLVVLVCGSACGRSQGTVTVDDKQKLQLLLRRPDLVAQEPGVLRPHSEHQWGRATRGAWREDTLSEGDGQLTVASKARQAGVAIEALEPRERRVAVALGSRKAPDHALSASAEVRLNGVTIGKAELEPQVRRFEFDTPAAVWNRGMNLLEVALDPESEASYFRMGAVEYGASFAVEYDLRGGGLTLRPGTCASYRVQRRPGADLRIAGTFADVPSTLELTIRPFDPASSVADSNAAQAHRFTAEAELAATLELPDALGLDLQLDLAFRGEPGAELRLRALTIERTGPAEAAEMGRSPVLLVVIDTLAARNMSVYGYPRPTTPNLERLAEDGVVFDVAYSNSSWTLPSFQALLSGLYPKAHDLDASHVVGRRAELWERKRLSPSRTTLAESFRSAGWSTFAHFDNAWLNATFGIDQGYDEFSSRASEIPVTDRSGGIELVSADLLRWLDEGASNAPFFATIHGFDVHGPYSAGEEWVERVSAVPSSIELPESILAGAMSFARGAAPKYTAGPRDEDERVDPHRLLDAYDAGIAEVDHKLGLLFEELRARGLYEDTLIVVTADHGEAMVDGASKFTHIDTIAAVTHVPLMVKLPGREFAGTRIEQPVQLVDLMPTLLDLTGIHFDPDRFHGRSLEPLMRGAELEQVPILSTEATVDTAALRVGNLRLVVHNLHDPKSHPAALLTYPGLESEFVREYFPETFGRPLTTERMDAITERFGGVHKLQVFLREVLPPVHLELYDVETDFYERNNLWAGSAELHRELLAALVTEWVRAVGARVAPEPDSAGQGLSDSQIKALQAVGYLDE